MRVILNFYRYVALIVPFIDLKVTETPTIWSPTMETFP